MENVNWPAMNFIWGALITLVTVASAIYSWWGRKETANKTALDRVENRLDGETGALKTSLGEGLTRVETTLHEQIAVVQKTNDSSTAQFRMVLDEQSRRITVAEEALKFAPKSLDLEKLRDSITALSTELARFGGTQRSLERTVERMNEHLMERSK